MGRVKLQFPAYNPLFTATIPVRIGDINYGNHVGNDSILSIIHEARMLMLRHHGYSEMNAAGNAMIMADVMIAYKGESFYGDTLIVKVFAEEITASTFNLLYHISVVRDGKTSDIAHAKTGMVCFDYATRKIVAMTAELKQFLEKGQ
jgi:YbgC/YbaW family acyl-CoA thioester hydrolase